MYDITAYMVNNGQHTFKRKLFGMNPIVHCKYLISTRIKKMNIYNSVQCMWNVKDEFSLENTASLSLSLSISHFISFRFDTGTDTAI